MGVAPLDQIIKSNKKFTAEEVPGSAPIRHHKGIGGVKQEAGLVEPPLVYK